MFSFQRLRGDVVKPCSSKAKKRRGVECVEVAVTLPLLMLATFGFAQIAHRWHVEKMLKLATYEAVKVGAMKDGNARSVENAFQEYARALEINDARIEFSQSDFDSGLVGTELRAQGSAPAASNRLNLPIFLEFAPSLTSGWVHARKEGL